MAVNAAGGYGSHPMARRLAGRSRWLARLITLVYPPMPTLNIIPQRMRQQIRAALFAPGAVVVNIGAGGSGGSGAWLWQARPENCQIIQSDLGPGPGIGLVADAAGLPFGDGTVDGLVLQAVLEHVREPEQVIAEALRVLRPGGHLYVEMPFLQGFHADPDDFQRYTLEGLRWRLRQFRTVEAGVSVGPFCTLVWLLRDGLSSWTSSAVLYAVLRFVAAWLFAPLRYLDLGLRNNRVAIRLANEFYALAEK